MTTVKELLIGQADTQAERDLIVLWMSEDGDALSARQRAWQDVQSRGNWARVQFRW